MSTIPRSTTAVSLLGIGKALPPHSIKQQDSAELAKAINCSTEKQERMLSALYQKARVRRRSSVFSNAQETHPGSFQSFFPTINHGYRGPATQDRMEKYAVEAPKIAALASREALANSRVKAQQIKHLITVSCTGFSAPGFDMHLIKQLKLPAAVSRTHIGFMGCHGAFNAMRSAAALANQHPGEPILISAVELCTLHFSYGWDPEQVVANSLFADGASSAVFCLRDHKSQGWALKSSGSFLFPDSESAMTWKIGNEGFNMTLSPKVPGLIERHLRSWLDTWLKKLGYRYEDIQTWAIHPGGPRILNAVESALHISEQSTHVSRKILSNHGNMSSATILFIIDELIRLKSPAPCVALGFGPGLALEAALFD